MEILPLRFFHTATVALLGEAGVLSEWIHKMLVCWTVLVTQHGSRLDVSVTHHLKTHILDALHRNKQ